MCALPHILIVHSDRHGDEYLCEQVRKRRCRVTHVDPNGLWSVVRADPPDLVVLDRGACSAAAGLCRDIVSAVGIPVIALIASHREADRIDLLEAGATDCLSEPTDIDELVARIHAVLRRTRGWEATAVHFDR